MLTILYISLALALVSCAALAVLIVNYRKAHTRVRKLTSRLMEVDQKLSNLMRRDHDPHVDHNYTASRSNEHCFELNVINTLDETITLQELYAFPPAGKVSYVEIAFPDKKDERGIMQVERCVYNDKVTLKRMRTAIGTEIRAGEQLRVRYTIKFRDAVIISQRPDIYVCYQMESVPGLREIHISERARMAKMQSLLPKDLTPLPVMEQAVRSW